MDRIQVLNKLKSWLYIWLGVTALLFPMRYITFPFHEDLIHIGFFRLTDIICTYLLQQSSSYDYFVSDGLHLHVLLVLLSIPVTIIYAIASRKSALPFATALASKIILYFLILILMKYGFMKLFNQQFYLPEPNILGTEFGQLDQDILYWSTMGTSRLYSIFLGAIEVLAALALIYKPTRIWGLIMALGIALNIFFVNLGFNIGVKLFSSFLLLITLILSVDYIKFSKTRIAVKKSIDFRFKNKKYIKILVLVFIFIEGFSLVFNPSGLNDDLAARPPLHGYFAALKQNIDHPVAIFIHRDHFWIQKSADGTMKSRPIAWIDFQKSMIQLQADRAKDATIIHFQLSGDTLFIGDNQHAYLKRDWRKFPAIQNNWNWIVQ